MAEKELSILVRAKNAAQAARDITKVDTAVSRLGSRVGRGFSAFGSGVQKGIAGTERAVDHLKGRLASLAAPLGAIGLTAGLFTITGAFEQGVTKAEDMALAVEKLTLATGLSAHTASQLVAVFGRFGIETDKVVTLAAFAEKTLGKLALTTTKHGVTTSKLTTLEKLYGVTLHTSTGRMVDYGTELNTVADFYVRHIKDGKGAALASTLFGKTWKDLLPVLALGSKGIAEVSKKADDLGLTLKSAQDVKNVHDFINAQRDAREAVGGLEVQLGLLVMPDLAAGLKNFTSFLTSHHEEVKQFFGDALHTAEGFAGFVTGSVVPAIAGLAGAASKFWGAIPAPLRDLLLKGFVADRTISFLFGVSPIKLVASLAEGGLAKALGGILGGFGQRGSSPANPVFVSGGGVGLPGSGGGGLTGLLSTVGLVPIVAAAAAAAFGAKAITDQTNSDFGNAGIKTDFQAPGSGNLPFGIDSSIHNILEMLRIAQAPKPAAPLTGGLSPDDRQALSDAAAKRAATILKTGARHDADSGPLRLSAKELQHAAAAHKAAAAALKAAAGKAHAAVVTKAKTILSTGARHDAETSASIAKLIPKDGAKSQDVEALRGKVGTGLAAAEAASRQAGQSTAAASRAAGFTAASAATVAGYAIVAAIQASRPNITVNTSISATTVQHTTTVLRRTGPRGSDRNSSARQLEGIA